MPYKDPVKAKAYHQAWVAAHQDEQRARRAAYYQAHKEERIEYTKQWVARNPERHSDNLYRNRVAKPWRNLIRMGEQRARKKGVSFSLDHGWGERVWTGRCAMTGLPFDMTKRSSGPKPRSPSIDRIEPAAGYTPTNCRFVLSCVNSFKHMGTEEDMFEVAEALLKHRESNRA